MYRPLPIIIIVMFVTSPDVAMSSAHSLSDDVPRYFEILNEDASCTDRCHVASPLYRNEFEGEIFVHTTHSPLQRLGCGDCHDRSDVKDEKHGKLLINREDCLRCHHVDHKDESCAKCHDDIDSNPMEYKDEPFLHGFDANSGVDCMVCHQPDAGSTLREGINCDNCHHTTPDIDCVKCHEGDLSKSFVGGPSQMMELGWTEQFLHSQHPEDECGCLECHPPAPYSIKGVNEYDVSCTECHHRDAKEDCAKCHKDFLDFFRGEVDYSGVAPVPDKMSRVVKCEDCHKFKSGHFLEVRSKCVECHNPQYGKLLDAQREVIISGLKEVTKKLVNLEHGNDPRNPAYSQDTYNRTFAGIELLQLYGLHNFSLATEILSFLKTTITGSKYGAK